MSSSFRKAASPKHNLWAAVAFPHGSADAAILVVLRHELHSIRKAQWKMPEFSRMGKVMAKQVGTHHHHLYSIGGKAEISLI